MELQKKWKSQHGTEYMVQLNTWELDHVIAGLRRLHTEVENECLKLEYELEKLGEIKKDESAGNEQSKSEFNEPLTVVPNGEGVA